MFRTMILPALLAAGLLCAPAAQAQQATKTWSDAKLGVSFRFPAKGWDRITKGERNARFQIGHKMSDGRLSRWCVVVHRNYKDNKGPQSSSQVAHDKSLASFARGVRTALTPLVPKGLTVDVKLVKRGGYPMYRIAAKGPLMMKNAPKGAKPLTIIMDMAAVFTTAGGTILRCTWLDPLVPAPAAATKAEIAAMMSSFGADEKVWLPATARWGGGWMSWAGYGLAAVLIGLGLLKLLRTLAARKG